MSSNTIISCKGIGKAFQLYTHQNDQLKQILFGYWKKYYKEKWVLNDVSFSIHRGERVGIVGRNGAGKTTLLQIICGITTQTKGSFEVNGRIAPILALGSGFDVLLSGRDNARIGAAILGMSNKEVDSCIEDIAAFAEIGVAFEQPIRTYSMGMIARLAFAICVYSKADILIVDEALSVGDQIFQEKCEAFIDEFSKIGTTLIVSHSLEFLVERCDRVLWLEDGIVKRIGAPEAVIEEYSSAMHGEQAMHGHQGALAWALRYITKNLHKYSS